MPAEFQKDINLILINCSNTYAYLDDILIVTKGSVEIHKKTANDLERLAGENLAISLDKRKLYIKLYYMIRKTEAIEKLSPPKQQKSFMGSIHHLTMYIPNLAQTAAALGPLLKSTEKNKPNNWKQKHNTSLENIKTLVSEKTKNFNFDQKSGSTYSN